ncbi:hypothetical protein [Methylopila sp. M107]|uniref:hypothetical protein n=1 Tax=Methylopila sp. M107 TaxID=1101190 RepID=UPI00035C150C|nr:hypothetical protein [Methylopila sp. M107]
MRQDALNLHALRVAALAAAATLAACSQGEDSLPRRAASPDRDLVAIVMKCPRVGPVGSALVGAVYKASQEPIDCDQRHKPLSSIETPAGVPVPLGPISIEWVARDRVVMTVSDEVVAAMSEVDGQKDLLTVRMRP